MGQIFLLILDSSYCVSRIHQKLTFGKLHKRRLRYSTLLVTGCNSSLDSPYSNKLAGLKHAGLKTASLRSDNVPYNYFDQFLIYQTSCLFTFQTLFVAHGPAFKKGKVVEHFQNTELYNVMAGKRALFILIAV